MALRRRSHSAEQLPQILAVHEAARVRGALHRSLVGKSELGVYLAPSIVSAKQICLLESFAAVLLPMTRDSLTWAEELRFRPRIPVVFCFSRQADMSLYEKARSQGLRYFVELPNDHPAAWARGASRIASTLKGAIDENQVRKKVFARSTVVMPAAPRDLAASRGAGERQQRTTIVREISEHDLTASSRSTTCEVPKAKGKAAQRKRRAG